MKKSWLQFWIPTKLVIYEVMEKSVSCGLKHKQHHVLSSNPSQVRGKNRYATLFLQVRESLKATKGE